MRALLKPLAFVVAIGCALSVPFAIAAPPPPPPPDDTNGDGSIKTGMFTGKPITWDFSRFTVLTSGSLNDTNNTVTGPSSIVGNVGIGGQGNFTMSDGELDGDLYINSYGKFTMSGPAKHPGQYHTYQDPTHGGTYDMVLANALSGANYLSQQAGTEMATHNYSVTQGSFNGMTVNTGQSITIVGPASTGKVVLNLQDFVMTGGTFTLSGGAMTSWIINVSRNFSLNNAKIVLNGIPSKDVLFNILGTGQDVSLQQGTSMQGILLATQRKVDLSGGKVFGRVIAEQLTLTSGGQVISQ